MKSVESVVLTVLKDLNLTCEKVNSEPLEENLLDVIKDKARYAANGIRNTKGKISDKVHAVGDAIGTDASIIRNGMLLVKGNEFVGIPEVKPDSQAAKDVMRHYPGYTIATPEQRAFAERQHVTIGAVDNAPWNLKTTLNDYLTKTITTLTQAKNDLSGRKVITASEAAGIMNTINSDEKDMLTHIEKANLMSTGPVVAASPAKTEAPSAASTPVESPAPTEPVSEPAKAPEPVSEPAKAPEPVSEPAKAPEPVSEPAKAPVPPTPRTPLSGPDGLPPAPPARNQAEEDMASYTQGAAKLQDPAVKQRIARAGALEDEDVAPNRNRTSQYESRNYSGPLDIFYN